MKRGIELTYNYNCELENGLKSAFYSLEELRNELKISDKQYDKILKDLNFLIGKSQSGKILFKG